MKVKLRDVSNIIMGQSPDSSTYNTEKIGLPFFQGNADFGELNPIAKTWCSAPIKIAYKNYILISVRAPIGALNIAAETCCIGRGLAAFDVNNKMCTQKYLWYLLKAKKNELLSKGTGSTFKAISKNILSEMEFNIPPVREQELCTKVLDVVFCLIRLKKEQLDKLDLLVKSRFIEMFGECKEEKALVDICSFIDYRGKTPEKSEAGIPLITAKNVKDNAFSVEPQEFIPAENYDSVMTRGIPKVNDVLFTTEAPLGNVCRIPAVYEKFCVGQRIITMQPNKDILTSEYLERALLTDKFQEKIWAHSSGSTVKGIRSKLLEKLTIPIPSLEAQREYTNFITQVDKSKFVVTAKFQ